MRVLPVPRGADLGLEAVVVEQLADLLRFPLPVRRRVFVRHRVVVVELDVVEAQVLVGFQLVEELPLRTDRRAKGSAPGCRFQGPAEEVKSSLRLQDDGEPAFNDLEEVAADAVMGSLRAVGIRAATSMIQWSDTTVRDEA